VCQDPKNFKKVKGIFFSIQENQQQQQQQQHNDIDIVYPKHEFTHKRYIVTGDTNIPETN